MEEKQAQVPSKLVDNGDAPEIFASWMQGVGFDGPNVRLTFVANRPIHDQSVSQVIPTVNLRLVMSVDSARKMVVFLNGFLAGAELNASEPPQGSALQ